MWPSDPAVAQPRRDSLMAWLSTASGLYWMQRLRRSIEACTVAIAQESG